MEQFFTDYFERLADLHRSLSAALDGLSTAALDWVPGPEMNSLAVLAVHTAGAERYWIGDVAGQAPSGRVRPSEFMVQGMTSAELLEKLAGALAHSQSVLASLQTSDLAAERLSPKDGRVYTVGWALAHALEHTGLHLGHIQIGRQLWDMHEEAQ